MNRLNQNRKVAQYAVGSALAVALIAGAADVGPLAMVSASEAVAAESSRSVEKAVRKAEKAVSKAPADAITRTTLAHTYLQAGRFESAAQTFRDAIHLGDSSPRTALSLALAYIGGGKSVEALAVLSESRDAIPAGDLGLAMALAGDTSGGVAILADALRAGEDTPTIRQNLAYAYALDGRWREARLMAAQDVPADQLDARISTWAQQGRPDQYRDRVATLLGTPVRNDPGQPAHLALAPAPAEPAQAFAVAEMPAAPSAGELAPIEDGESFWTAGVDIADAEPAAAPAVPAAIAAVDPAPSDFDRAFIDTEPTGEVRYVSQPVVQVIPTRTAKSETPVAAPRKVTLADPAPVASTLAPASRAPHAAATHVVQLGSFSSERNAERAWKIYLQRNPELASYDKVITPAVVRGKKYYRVIAAGFDRREARSLCSAVKGRGNGCLAYAASNPLPGALPSTTASGPMRARR